MKKIILHIGQPKTGSSALQNYFYHNKSKLEAKKIGYYYPKYSYTPWPSYSNGSLLLAEAVVRLNEPKDKKKKQWLNNHPSLDIFSIRLKENIIEKTKEIKEDFKLLKQYSKEYETLIFSEELLWHNIYFYDHFFKTIKEILNEIFLEEIDLDILIYLRRQDKWLLSKWKEDMRNEIASPLDFYETLKDYEEIGYLNYYYGLKQIAKDIDKKHIIVKTYDHKSFINGSIENDFISSFINNPEDLFIKDSNQINVNIGIKTALALLLINKGIVNITDRDLRFYRASEIFNKYFDANNNSNIMDENEIKKLLAYYQKSNTMIEKEFLNNKQLFDYEINKQEIIKVNYKRDKLNAYIISLIAKFL